MKIVSRESPLARIQVDEALQFIRPLFPDTTFEKITVTSPGDRDLSTPLSDPTIPDDFFTRDVDEAVLSGQADLSVHSAKDLPPILRPGLVIAALLPARDIRDVLVYRKGFSKNDPIKTLGVSSDRREAFLRERFPDAVQKPLRGTIEERIEKADAGEFDAIITAACALDRLGLAHRINEMLPYDPTPQQGRLAIVTRDDRQELNQTLAKLCVKKRAGLVALVGCPSDESLLTEKARQYLNHADVVVHDRLIPDNILLSIQEKAISVGKADGQRSISQSEIHRILLAEAEQGKLVVRLQGGDPLIFAHLAEELEFLNDWNIRTDIVTSVSAAQVAAARASSPLTHRGGGKSITILSGRPVDLPVAEKLPGPGEGNLAIYMGAKRFEQLAERLQKAGWPHDAPVVIGERIGYKDEWVHQAPLNKVCEMNIEVPSVFLVGVQSYQPQQRTLFTGTNPGQFLKHGPLIHWPMIKLVQAPINSRMQDLQERLNDLDGILFPGGFAVRSFIEALTTFSDARALAGKTLVAINNTAAEELLRHGLRADFNAGAAGGMKHVAEQLTARGTARLLYPCSDTVEREVQVARFKHMEIDLQPSVFYFNRTSPFRDLPRMPFERVLFTNTKTVEAYFEQHPEEREAHRTWLAVGPSTLQALEEKGFHGQLV